MKQKEKRIYRVRDTRPPIDWDKVCFWKDGKQWLAANPRTGKVYQRPISRKCYETQVAFWLAWHSAVGRKLARKRWKKRCAKLRAMGIKLSPYATAAEVAEIELELERRAELEKGRAEVGESGTVL